MKLDTDTLRQMVHEIVTTSQDEIACGQCFEQLDQFVEMVLAGRNVTEAMPLVEEHLERCQDCREEFQALLTVLRGLNS